MRLTETVNVLEKRLNHLETRIQQAEASGRDFTFDKQEASALRTALDILINLEPRRKPEGKSLMEFVGAAPDLLGGLDE